MAKSGRPRLFTTKKEDEAVDLAYEGRSIVEIGSIIGLTPKTIWQHRKQVPLFDVAMETALVAGAFDRLDHLVREIDTNLSKQTTPTAAKNRWDIWRAWSEKRFPTVFAPRQQVDVNHTFDVGPALAHAAKRALEHTRSMQVIDLVADRVELSRDGQSLDAPNTSAPGDDHAKNEGPGD